MEHSFFNVLVPIKNNKYLAYNTLSLELEVINREDYESLVNNTYSQYHPRILDYINRGFIAPNAKEQYDEVAKGDFANKKTGSFIHLTIMMSESCNFSCSYCNQGQDKENLVISGKTIEAISQYIKKVAKPESIVDITWFGGEPLLNIDKLLKASEELEETCIKIGATYKARVLTNGFLLNQENAIKLYNNNIRTVQVSFDGDKSSHDQSRYARKGSGTYDIILKNISDVLNVLPLDFKLSLRVNVSKANYARLPLLIEDLVHRNLSNKGNFVVYWGHIYDPTTSNIEDATNIDEIILDHRSFGETELEMNKMLVANNIKASHTINESRGNCIATQKNSFVIRPNGELHKCYIPVSNRSNACGTIFEVNNAISSENFKKWDSWSAFEEDNCKRCKLVGSCRGGCPINYISENFSKGEYKCPPSKLFLNEHLFERAVNKNLVKREEWDNSCSPTKVEELKISQLC